jgi:glycerol-3-phosphate dehydrogenase
VVSTTAGATPSPSSSVLSPIRRSEDLKRAQQETFDIVIVGGGVTGVGAALDAASRGLNVCLVERRDFAAGTSSRSSKLVHGGLRYLEQFDFALVREALHERAVLINDVAPHLVKPAPFLLPLRKHYERPYIGSGVLLYDLLAGRHRAVPFHKHLSKKGCVERFPSINADTIVGGIQYYDAQIDDARHTVVVARTAAQYGAAMLSAVRVDRIVVEGGRAVGVEVTDREPNGGPFRIKAKAVINATGVWASELEGTAGVKQPLKVTASKGVHLVIPRHRIQASTAMILRTDRSVLFLLPWGDRWLIGTTDTPWSHDLDHPAVTSADVDYVLHWANKFLTANLTVDDIVGTYAGLRPLIAGGATATTKLSREHAVNKPIPGLVSIAGGKYTTYRLMGRDAVDATAEFLGGSLPSSTTHEIGLLGADGHRSALANLRAHKGCASLPSGGLEHLVARYGSTARELLDMVAADPSLGAAIPSDAPRNDESTNENMIDPSTFDGAHTPMSNGARYLLVEAAHAAAYEGALHLDDVLTRRTRLSIEGTDRGIAAAAPVTQAMGNVLGWSVDACATEVKHYEARVAAERAATQTPSDTEADAVRSPVRDLRLVNQ